MFNMNSKKSRRRFSAALIVILVLAMVIPTVAYFSSNSMRGLWMKKMVKRGYYLAFALICMLFWGISAQAKEEDTIKTGIYAGKIDLSGMTADEARAAVEEYVSGLRDTEITLLAAGDAEVVVTAGDMGMEWGNPELVTEAAEIGTHGNVIERYRILKDLEHENKIYPIELSFDLQAINDILTENASNTT